MSLPRATVKDFTSPGMPNVRQLEFNWQRHVPHWERAGKSDPAKCFAEVAFMCHVEAGWVSMTTMEVGEKSVKKTMLSLHKEEAERLALWILKSQGWVPANGGIVSPGSIVRPSTIPYRSIVVEPR